MPSRCESMWAFRPAKLRQPMWVLAVAAAQQRTGQRMICGSGWCWGCAGAGGGGGGGGGIVAAALCAGAPGCTVSSMRPRLAALSGLVEVVPPLPLATARWCSAGPLGESPSVKWRRRARPGGAPGVCTNVFFTLSGTSSRQGRFYGCAAGPGWEASPIRLLRIGSNAGVRLGRHPMQRHPQTNPRFAHLLQRSPPGMAPRRHRPRPQSHLHCLYLSSVEGAGASACSVIVGA